MLQFLRMPVAKIEQAILELDDELLVEENIAGLLNVYPTTEELKLVAKLSSEQVQRMSAATKFFYLCHVNAERKLDLRLRCWLSMNRFEANSQSVAQRQSSLSHACEVIMTSSSLRCFLQFVLV